MKTKSLIESIAIELVDDLQQVIARAIKKGILDSGLMQILEQVPADSQQPVKKRRTKAFTPCKREGCGRKAFARGLCSVHLRRNKKEKHARTATAKAVDRTAGLAVATAPELELPEVSEHPTVQSEALTSPSRVQKSGMASELRCSYSDCDRKVHSKGLCKSHLMLLVTTKRWPAKNKETGEQKRGSESSSTTSSPETISSAMDPVIDLAPPQPRVELAPETKEIAERTTANESEAILSFPTVLPPVTDSVVDSPQTQLSFGLVPTADIATSPKSMQNIKRSRRKAEDFALEESPKKQEADQESELNAGPVAAVEPAPTDTHFETAGSDLLEQSPSWRVKTCAFPGCGRQARLGRRFCTKHNQLAKSISGQEQEIEEEGENAIENICNKPPIATEPSTVKPAARTVLRRTKTEAAPVNNEGALCSRPRCDREVFTKGLCVQHYMEERKRNRKGIGPIDRTA